MTGSPASGSLSFADEQGMLGFFHTLERLKVCSICSLVVRYATAPKSELTLPSFSLSQTNKRTGWVNQNIRQPESIADHVS